MTKMQELETKWAPERREIISFFNLNQRELIGRKAMLSFPLFLFRLLLL